MDLTKIHKYTIRINCKQEIIIIPTANQNDLTANQNDLTAS